MVNGLVSVSDSDDHSIVGNNKVGPELPFDPDVLPSRQVLSEPSFRLLVEIDDGAFVTLFQEAAVVVQVVQDGTVDPALLHSDLGVMGDEHVVFLFNEIWVFHCLQFPERRAVAEMTK